MDVAATDAFDVVRSPSIGAIVALGILLMAIFLIWMAVANAIYVAYFGYAPPASIGQFAHDLFTTLTGWKLIVVGNGVGFLFALAALMISVVSFPLLLDHEVGAAVAVLTSVRAVLANPLTAALWGLIVAGLLMIGSLPLFLGLPVVLPVLGTRDMAPLSQDRRSALQPSRGFPPAADWAALCRGVSGLADLGTPKGLALRLATRGQACRRGLPGWLRPHRPPRSVRSRLCRARARSAARCARYGARSWRHG